MRAEQLEGSQQAKYMAFQSSAPTDMTPHQLSQSLFQLHPNYQERGNLVGVASAYGSGSPGSGRLIWN